MGLEHYFLRDQVLDAATIKAAVRAAREQNISLTLYLTQSGILSSSFILNYCAKKFELPVFDLKNYDFNWLRETIIQSEIIYRHRIIPLHREQNNLYLGITDPTNHAAMTTISFQTGLRIRPMLVGETELDKIITQYCGPHRLHSQLESTLSKLAPVEEQSGASEVHDSHDEPVIDFVDNLLRDAIDKKITDIHIEPYAKDCRIRFRRDGLLYEATSLPLHLSTRVTTRLKIMADLNIAERRLPQDGRILLRKETKMDIRTNTCPTLFGEKMVLRLFNAAHLSLDIEDLGLTTPQKDLLLARLSRPQGLILVTGPTGSGKTVTLYSALHYLNRIEKNISTVEDPIEIELHGINQVNIHTRIGLDYASVLRTFLRQDPDIIMIGEIRDTETANTAMQAAQTGHLVLSTLHTNSAAETLMRLQSMGVATYNIIHSVSLIMAQRLVRKLCPFCKQPDTDCSIQGTYQALGCEQCHQGYQGRVGIFELLPLTDEITRLLLSQAAIPLILEQARLNHWPLLWEAGLEKVKQGETSYAELSRVTGNV